MDSVDREPWKKSMFYKQVITDMSQEEEYLIRWNLSLPFNLGSIKLHQIKRPDSDRCQHNHPWGFIRFILWGGYVEEYGEDNQVQVLRPGTITWCPANFRHRITRLLNGRTSWSLVITGPRIQSWGFFTREGFIGWRKFVESLQHNRIAWCEDGSSVEVGKDAST